MSSTLKTDFFSQKFNGILCAFRVFLAIPHPEGIENIVVLRGFNRFHILSSLSSAPKFS